jgi:hypothetical protein
VLLAVVLVRSSSSDLALGLERRRKMLWDRFELFRSSSGQEERNDVIEKKEGRTEERSSVNVVVIFRCLVTESPPTPPICVRGYQEYVADV